MAANNLPPEINLPAELIEFLDKGKQLSYDQSSCEPGKVILRQNSELTIRSAWIEPSELSSYAVWNPHQGQDGYYEVPCVSLTKEAEGYNPDGILIWIPKLKLFATCDAGHGIVWLFPMATWMSIIADPAVYLGAQWNINPEIQALLVPWGFFNFRAGNPYDNPAVITS